MNILDYAIKMEMDGEKYYREQAEINKDNELFVVCNLLAEDESNHVRLLEHKKNQTAYQLEDSDLRSKVQNIFTGLKDMQVNGTNDPRQLDFYRIACDMERQSIDLYREFLSASTEEEDKKLLEFLVNQEKQHLEVFEEISRLLYNAEWWIESAEFGIRREEY